MKNISIIIIFLLILTAGCSTAPVNDDLKSPQPVHSSAPNSPKKEIYHSTSNWMQNMWMK